MNIEIQILD